MTPQLWIALGFVAALVAFLMIAYFTKDTSTINQQRILRFLTALCAGFGGGFFTGDALVRLQQQLSNGATLGISGTAGFALFFVVWLTYFKWVPPSPPPPPPPDRIKVSIPEGWTFEQAARVVIKAARGTADFPGFRQEQLAVKMRATDLDESDAHSALTKLRYAAYDGLPKYRVELEGSVFHICNLDPSHASQEHL